jgi:hypothetical protein
MFGGEVLVRKLLDVVQVDPGDFDLEPPEVERRVGRHIGILERGLLLTLVFADALSGVGLVIAAKSLARFKELDKKGLAEYYLVGTLASTLTAVGLGLLVKSILPHL